MLPRLLSPRPKSGASSDGPPAKILRLAQLLLFLQGDGQVIEGVRIIGGDFQRPPPAGDRLVQFPLLQEGVAEVIVGLEEIMPKFSRPAIAIDGLGNVPRQH